MNVAASFLVFVVVIICSRVKSNDQKVYNAVIVDKNSTTNPKALPPPPPVRIYSPIPPMNPMPPSSVSVETDPAVVDVSNSPAPVTSSPIIGLNPNPPIRVVRRRRTTTIPPLSAPAPTLLPSVFTVTPSQPLLPFAKLAEPLPIVLPSVAVAGDKPTFHPKRITQPDSSIAETPNHPQIPQSNNGQGQIHVDVVVGGNQSSTASVAVTLNNSNTATTMGRSVIPAVERQNSTLFPLTTIMEPEAIPNRTGQLRIKSLPVSQQQGSANVTRSKLVLTSPLNSYGQGTGTGIPNEPRYPLFSKPFISPDTDTLQVRSNPKFGKTTTPVQKTEAFSYNLPGLVQLYRDSISTHGLNGYPIMEFMGQKYIGIPIPNDLNASFQQVRSTSLNQLEQQIMASRLPPVLPTFISAFAKLTGISEPTKFKITSQPTTLNLDGKLERNLHLGNEKDFSRPKLHPKSQILGFFPGFVYDDSVSFSSSPTASPMKPEASSDSDLVGYQRKQETQQATTTTPSTTTPKVTDPTTRHGFKFRWRDHEPKHHHHDHSTKSKWMRETRKEASDSSSAENKESQEI